MYVMVQPPPNYPQVQPQAHTWTGHPTPPGHPALPSHWINQGPGVKPAGTGPPIQYIVQQQQPGRLCSNNQAAKASLET